METQTTTAQTSRLDQVIQNVLLKAGVLNRAQLERPVDEARRRKVPLLDTLLEGRYVSEDQLADTFANWSRLPRVRLAAVNVQSEALRQISESLARRYICMPVTVDDRTLVVAMANPLDYDAVQDLQFATGLTIKPVVASRTEILDGVEEQYGTNRRLHDMLQFVPDTSDVRMNTEEAPVLAPDPSSGVTITSVESTEVAEANADDAPVVKMSNVIIRDAIEARASDIHIEPALHTVQVRLRVDGTLRDFMQVPKWLHNALVSRLKVLSKLDISEKRLPQDGRINVQLDGRQLDMRVSTLPTLFGEKVVMRVLGSQTVPDLAQMVSESQLATIRGALSQPQGTILVTGPTGSGKTTTLYSMVMARRSPELNIVTVEDPIEYRLDGVTQVQVNARAGLTFAGTLRAILRQDPDVVLLGEIRDLETAQIAFQASQTGHLVLSTLHTGSAIATVTRLIDLGIEAFMISSSVNLIVAQRLARRICDRCHGRKSTAAHSVTADASEGKLMRLDDLATQTCDKCAGTGFAGRVGIYELLPMVPRLRELIHARAPEAELRKTAQQIGVKFLMDDAQEKVRGGVTTSEEVARVVHIQQEATVLCPECRAVLGAEFAACPYCLHTLRLRCGSCGQDLRRDWKICPYCNTRTAQADVHAPEKARIPARLPAMDGATFAAFTESGATLLPKGGSHENGHLGSHENRQGGSHEGVRAAAAASAEPTPAAAQTNPAPAPVTSSAPAAPTTGLAVPPPPDGDSTGPAHRRLRVLVVDDDQDIQTVVRATVSRLSVATDIRTAKDGIEAVDKVREQIPDLIVLDINMPRMDGFTVCETLRSDIRTAFVPILMLTANADESSRSKGYLVGTDDYMSKPFAPPDLNLRITRLLRRTYGV
ncbi:MAG: Flp pilus assembly complex ATPase component TadA [Acidobacteria bacterium]|nr:Flp pilus assembly complex ATPase component TadA [Acidobacteriota bacterium]